MQALQSQLSSALGAQATAATAAHNSMAELELTRERVAGMQQEFLSAQQALADADDAKLQDTAVSIFVKGFFQCPQCGFCSLNGPIRHRASLCVILVLCSHSSCAISSAESCSLV